MMRMRRPWRMRLIDGNALYEKACDLEAQALDYAVKISNDEEKREEWLRWSAILAERSAFRHDVYDAPTIEPEPQWIPCSERLPEEAYPVIVTWKNGDPASYYQYILGKHYVGVAHYKNGKWFWYSSVTEDTLMEYGRCDSEEFDEAIEVLAWMPLPKPYGGEQDG
jgi:hypothetical protein